MPIIQLADILIHLMTDTNNQSDVYILLHFYIRTYFMQYRNIFQLHPNSISIS